MSIGKLARKKNQSNRLGRLKNSVNWLLILHAKL